MSGRWLVRKLQEQPRYDSLLLLYFQAAHLAHAGRLVRRSRVDPDSCRCRHYKGSKPERAGVRMCLCDSIKQLLCRCNTPLALEEGQRMRLRVVIDEDIDTPTILPGSSGQRAGNLALVVETPTLE